jgi:hypothetical protein
MSSVLAPDHIETGLFAGLTMTVDQLDLAALDGLRVGVLAATSQHVRVLPDVVRHAAKTKLFLTRPVNVIPASRLGLGLQLVAPLARSLACVHRWRAVPEPELRRKITPLGRPVSVVVSGEYLRAVQHPRCSVVSWPVAGVVAAGVRTADGLEHHVDVIFSC